MGPQDGRGYIVILIPVHSGDLLPVLGTPRCKGCVATSADCATGMDRLACEVLFLFFRFGSHGGVYKGWVHAIVPFVGRKNGTLMAMYDDVHGWYKAWIEQLFAYLWQWGLVRTSSEAVQISCIS